MTVPHTHDVYSHDILTLRTSTYEVHNCAVWPLPTVLVLILGLQMVLSITRLGTLPPRVVCHALLLITPCYFPDSVPQNTQTTLGAWSLCSDCLQPPLLPFTHSMALCGALRWLVLAALVASVSSVARFNAWGWVYDAGAPIAKERRVNIVVQMLITGGNVAATAAFVKVVPKTVRKWWRRWQNTGGVEVVKESRRGPPPVLSAAALLYLLCLSEMNRKWTLVDYQENLLTMIGVAASERVICAALKRLGQHRKKTSVKKVEGLTPHGAHSLAF